MRSAPPVLVPVGRFVWSPRVVAVLALVSALVCALAGWGYGYTVGRAAVLAVCWGLSVSVAWRVLRRETLPPGALRWDGQSWWFQESGGQAMPVGVALQWDAGSAMLLQLRSSPERRWPRYAWLQASQLPAQWHGLRCAVHAGDTL